MEKDAAGYPQGHTNPGISRYLASRLPYITSSSEGGGGDGAVKQPRRPPTLLISSNTAKRFALLDSVILSHFMLSCQHGTGTHHD